MLRHRMVAIWCASVLTAMLVNGQPELLPAARVFRNVKVLTGIPVDEFMATMGFFSASLGMTCTDYPN